MHHNYSCNDKEEICIKNKFILKINLRKTRLFTFGVEAIQG